MTAGVSFALITSLALVTAFDVAPASHARAAHLATFVPGCEILPPHTKTAWLGEDRPVPRPHDAPVSVHYAGSPPAGDYRVIAQLELVARTRNTSLHNLLDHAQKQARRLGGQMLVDVTPSFADDPEGNPRRIRVTADVAVWP